MSRLLAATLAGALALSACAPAQRMSAPAHVPAAPKAELSDGYGPVNSVHFHDGFRMYSKRKYRQATKAFQRATEDNPGDYAAPYMAGMSYLNRGRYTDAQDAFRQALERAPDRVTASRVYSAMGYSYEVGHLTRMAHHYYHLACKANKANRYAQAGSARTEYRDLTKGRK